MKIIKISKDNITSLEKHALALGYFDGMHIGHQKIVSETIKEARSKGIKAAVFTFSNSPKDLFANSSKPTNISGLSESKILLEEMGVDYLIIFTVTKEDLMSISADAFINKYIKLMGTKTVICGKDFSFGKDKVGKAENITKISGKEIETIIIPFVKKNGKKISSKVIKKHLQANDLEKAKEMLGRNFAIIGRVQKGAKIGRALGFKTANIKIQDLFSIELNGVFAVQVNYKNQIFQGIANVGVAPTLQNLKTKQLEIFLFNFDENIYKKDIKISFLKFLRKEKKFDSPKKLIKQIREDIIQVKKYFLTKT